MTDTQMTAIIVGGFGFASVIVQSLFNWRLRRQSYNEHWEGHKTCLETHMEVKEIKEAVNGTSQQLKDEIASLKAQLKRERED